MSTSCLRRISRIDMRSIDKRNLNEHGIFIEFNENDITEALAMIIAPKDSVYRNGILYFKIKFPIDYPFNPPKVSYISRGSIRIHPNLYTGISKDNYLGKVCLSILGTWSGPQWTTIMDIGSVLLSIQSLLDNNPLDNEPGFTGKITKNHKIYKDCIEYEKFRTLIIKNIFNIPGEFNCFKDVVLEHYKNKREIIINELEELDKGNKNFSKINLSIYRINLVLDYTSLKVKLQDIEQVINK